MKRKIIAILLASALAPQAVMAEPEAGAAAAAQGARRSAAATPRYTARQFFDTTAYSVAPGDLAFSRDGRHLLVGSDQSGVFNVTALPIAGGSDPVRLTNSTASAIFPVSYFPSDERILYTSDRAATSSTTSMCAWRTAAAAILTPGEKLKANFAGWSGDGRTFYITTNERDPRYFDLYAYDAASYERKLIFQNTDYQPAAVSRDGRHVALVKPISSARSEVYLAQIGSSAPPRLITPHPGNVNYGVYSFTPDFAPAGLRHQRTGRVEPGLDLRSGQRREAPADRRRVGRDGRLLLTLRPLPRPRAQRRRLDQAHHHRHAQRPPGDDPGNSRRATSPACRFNRDESMIAFTLNASTSPTDIYVANLRSGQARRLTRSLNPAIDQRQLVEGKVARFRSYDGLEVPGILYRPREASAARPVPAIVLVHGGPGGQARLGYNAMVQHLVNHG
jgi:dipeptidyl aminopeptidase/acylaminoacyl peptidase